MKDRAKPYVIMVYAMLIAATAMFGILWAMGDLHGF